MSKRADFWTNVNFYGNLLIKPVINTIAMGVALDNLAGFSSDQQEWASVSIYGLVTGSVMSVICSLGEARAHRSLNSHHQDEEEAPSYNLMRPINNDIPVSYSEISLITANNKKICPITTTHLVLAADFFSHSFDVSGPLTIAYHALRQSSSSVWQNRGIQLGIFLLSCISTVAETRTCKHHLDLDNKDSAHGHSHGHSHAENHGHSHGHSQGHSADFWTKFNFPIELLIIFLNNLIFMGTIIDMTDADAEISNLSKPALLLGIAWGTLIAVPTAYCHYRLNLNNQSQKNIHHNEISDSKSSIFRYIGRGCDTVSHVIERASPLSSTIKLMVSSKNSVLNLGIMFLTSVASIPISIADSRTCAKNMKK